LTLKVGTFGVILTRKMLFYAVLVVTAALAIYAFLLVETTYNHDMTPISGLTWAAFSSEVGHAAWLKNKRQTELTFLNKFVTKGIHWDGYIVRVILADDDGSATSMYHAATILVKMN